MKTLKTFFFALAIMCFAIAPTVSNAQSGNPLNNIPVTYPGVGAATLSIDDFRLNDAGEIVITSTLTFSDGNSMAPLTATVESITATPNSLFMTIGGRDVTIDEKGFVITGLVVSVTNTKNDNRLKTALTSLSQLLDSNASKSMIIAKLKQVVRAQI